MINFDHTNKKHIIKIINGCKNCDRKIQNQLFKMMYGKMMTICMRYSNNEENAKDIMSESFVKVFSKISKVNPENENLEGWVRKIVVNTAIDYYRKNNKKNNLTDSINDDSYVQIPSKDKEFELEGFNGEYIIKMIQELPNSYRTAFNLHVIEGKQHSEVAKILGISEGTSKSNNARARKILKFKINKRNLDENNRIANLEVYNSEFELNEKNF